MLLDANMLKEPADFVAECKKKEEEFEINGIFNEDCNENSYDNAEPVTENFPYIKKGLKHAIKHLIFGKAMKIYTKRVNDMVNLQIEGKENLKGLKGAVVTCNHISLADSFPIRKAVTNNYKYVAADFNNWKGLMGETARYTGYLPLPMNLDRKIMRKFNEAIDYYLKKGKKVLIYPEQAMWRDYTKPRPLKNGAFHYAVKNNVPILPLFYTIKPKEQHVDEQGKVNFGDYTLHILKPIYPNPELGNKENLQYLKLENFRLWKECYEQAYGIPLTYTTKPEIWDANYSEYNQLFNHPATMPAKTKSTKTAKSTTTKSTTTKTTGKKVNSTKTKKSK